VEDDGVKTEEALLARPKSIEHTGLRFSMLSDLALKTVYVAGELSGQEVAEALRLPFGGVVDRLLSFLDHQNLLQVTGSVGFGEQAFCYSVSRKGTEQGRELFQRCQYVGPAPVSLKDYSRMIRLQGVSGAHIGRQSLQQAFHGLVMNDAMLSRIGAALHSGRSIFLYGPSGNGKTSIARAMARVMSQDGMYIPYAVEAVGQIIRVYDEFSHRRFEPQPRSRELGDLSPQCFDGTEKAEVDERWVLIERPVVVVGGELTLDSLDLIHNTISNYYEAPHQMKANGGMFLIDDFGRQAVNPRDLLNRWIVPLETRVDFLSLHTGAKIEIPFEQQVVFATNLDPAELLDEAFLRRIRHKIKVDDPTPEEFAEVFRAVCAQHGVPYHQGAFQHLMENWYIKPKRVLRCSQPRDIVEQILDICEFEGLPPQLTPEHVDRACDAYFADL